MLTNLATDTSQLGPSLPPAEVIHWTPRLKAQVLAALGNGSLSLAEAATTYSLSQEELRSWQDAMAEHGVAGLQVKKVAERRRAARRQVTEAATIVLRPSQHLSCRITDIGPHGARLSVDMSVRLPQSFELKSDRTGRSVQASVVWKRHGVLGVKLETLHAKPHSRSADLGSWLIRA